MEWMGKTLQDILKQKGLTMDYIAERIGTSRQSISEWIKGSVPTGRFIIKLCKELEITPADLFSPNEKPQISIPAHKTHMRAKVTDEMQNDAYKISAPYVRVFEHYVNPLVIKRIETNDFSVRAASQIALNLRAELGLDDETPITFNENQIFKYLDKLGLFVILLPFPDTMKSNAFYVKIAHHRVIFLESHIHSSDLIFHLLHESIHSILPEDQAVTNEIDKFCDCVASYLQFPDKYVACIIERIKADLISGNKNSIIDELKDISKQNHHSVYGLCKRLYIDEQISKDIMTSAVFADKKLKKDYPSIGDIFDHIESPVEYLQLYESISPRFVKMIRDESSHLSNSKIAELFQLSNSIDGHILLNLLRKEERIEDSL